MTNGELCLSRLPYLAEVFGWNDVKGHTMSDVMGGLKLWWVAFVEKPSKKGDWEGEEPSILNEGKAVLVLAESKEGAGLKGAAKAGMDVTSNKVKVYVVPFDE